MTASTLSIRARVLAVGAVLVALCVGTGYTSALAFTRVSRAMGAALRDDREAVALLSTLAAAVEDEDDVVLMSLSGQMPNGPALAQAERTRFDIARARLGTLTTDDDERKLIVALTTKVGTYRALSDSVLSMGGSPRAHELYGEALAPLVRQATSDCSRLREHRFQSTQKIAAAARDEAARATVVVSIAALGSLLLLGLIAWHVARTVLRPLAELTSAVDAMREGDFERRVVPSTGDELSTLGLGFNRMAEAVAEFRRSKLGEVLAANATLTAALEALPEAVLVVDQAGGIARMNARARVLFESVLGRMPRILEELPLPGLAGRLVDARRGLEPKNPSRADLGRSIALQIGGEDRRFSLRVLPIGDAGGAPVDAVVVLDDVTEFARLDEMRTEFIATASHELRTPLTTLQMTLSLLGEAAHRLTPGERETIATAELGCRQLATTVDEFLDLATIDAGAIVYDEADFDLAALLGQMDPLFAPRFEERGVTLGVRMDNELPQICGDRVRLSAALSNVLTNALKYSPPGGAVTVAATFANAHVDITVSDEGPGVPEDLRDRIFEKYFRVEHQVRREASRGVRGAGIGLYLCRQIVEGHHGTVRCESSPSGGASIRLRLPRSIRAKTVIERGRSRSSALDDPLQ